ncbi:uncharacterized hydrolase YugF isoform X2 [Momordica charantia]|uniref:Uncharacterized hydrolase YugF isoform X2 n=1 Tax=Momordica charantia TaxID=3673 RepID=A0A6J1DKB6_MOMCH|nr:uncharacterized hydrolase YugF isoform X2 [Momordica charantia]
MATACSSTLPFSKLPLPFSSAKPSISIHPFLQQLRFPLRAPTFPFARLKSKGTVLSSQLRVHFEDHGLETSSDNIHSQLQVKSRIWKWKGYSIRYQCSGDDGPALVLIHGFGANSDHWRKNISALAESHRVYALDLIGYGYSDKPNPDVVGESFYTFETWAAQLNDFCVDVVQDEAFFICNSIGGVVGLQAAVMKPQICKGLHCCRNTALGKYFFRTVATPESVKNILCQCYHDTSQVTDELVQIILNPGLQPGAADIFLEFICYSGGPLPEELLPRVKCPVLIAWGDKDPWEPIELGRNYRSFESVEDFVVLPNVGHCPQDEAPHLVNPLVKSFVSRHATRSASACTSSGV